MCVCGRRVQVYVCVLCMGEGEGVWVREKVCVWERRCVCEGEGV